MMLPTLALIGYGTMGREIEQAAREHDRCRALGLFGRIGGHPLLVDADHHGLNFVVHLGERGCVPDLLRPRHVVDVHDPVDPFLYLEEEGVGARADDLARETHSDGVALVDLVPGVGQDLLQADFHIVTVPTPIDASKNPDLEPLRRASTTIGQALKKGDIVVYESTVYPGVTEEVCIPVLEKSSGLRWKADFNVGYSPERINPGDREHTLTKILKIVSGDTPETLDYVRMAQATHGVAAAIAHLAQAR